MSKLSKSDVKKALIRSMCYQWQSFNYETMQSPGFTRFIVPSLQKIYAGNDELIAQKTEQYLSTFYNTENTMGQIIHGNRYSRNNMKSFLESYIQGELKPHSEFADAILSM